MLSMAITDKADLSRITVIPGQRSGQPCIRGLRVLASRISSKGQVTLPKQVRERIGAKPGDTIVYEMAGKSVKLRRLDRFDAAFHAALSATLEEWASPEDDEAFRNLLPVGRGRRPVSVHGSPR